MARNSSAKQIHLLISMAFAVGAALLITGSAHATEASDADNTRINNRDAEMQKPTPLDQSNTNADTAIVAKIRSAITDDKSLSVNAHNVKVIVRGGTVTLRGPVDSAAEKARVEAIAKNVAGVTAITNEIDIRH